MTVNLYTLNLNLNNKYFYIETLKEVFGIFNRRKLTKILDFQNKKKLYW